MSAISRSAVYWIGSPPTNEERLEFERRSLAIYTLAADSIINFNIARAIVFNATPPYVPEVLAQIGCLRTALNHGLMFYLLAADDAIQAHLLRIVSDVIRRTHLVKQVRLRTGPVPYFECAENIARHDAGRHANTNLQIQLPPDVRLNADQEFMIRRAFSDCLIVSLEPLNGGRSATAFFVQATLEASKVGPWPLPFLVKLDEARRILIEGDNYQLYATHHIPWYLRPNLDPSRCLYGVDGGILVGSFVEQSESLWQAVFNGKGPRYIHALFEDTLMGWRSQAYRVPLEKRSLANSLDDVFKWEKVPLPTVEQAKLHGPVQSPQVLWEQLLNLPEQHLRIATMHGDLHAENIRVRNNDAIIIDLANVCRGPLSADIASLEVWLAFQVPCSKKQIPDQAVWMKVAKELFSPNEVNRPPGLASTDIGLDWLRGCIRQTRMMASAVCECDTEYPTVIALYLLRHAQYTTENDEDAYRRSYAYFLGSQLVEWLTTELLVSGNVSE